MSKIKVNKPPRIKLDKDTKTIYVPEGMTPAELERELMNMWGDEWKALHVTDTNVHVERKEEEE